MNNSVTEQGRKTFGEFFKQSRLEKGLHSLDATAKWLTEVTGIKVSSDTVRRIEDSHWKDGFAFDSLIAIEDSKLLNFPSGEPMDVHDMMEILRERLNPTTGKPIKPKSAKSR